MTKCLRMEECSQMGIYKHIKAFQNKAFKAFKAITKDFFLLLSSSVTTILHTLSYL